MTITAAFVLFAVIWFMCLFIGLQVRIRTQADVGEKVDGTPQSAPATGFDLKTRVKWVTLVTVVLWIATCGIILSGIITVDDIDFLREFREG